MTVATLIKILQKKPQDYEVVIHEKGTVWDREIEAVYVTEDAKKNDKKIVTIQG